MTSNYINRISFLDTFRFVAVTFALVSHVSISYHLTEFESDFGLLRVSLTRTATPSLLILFGVMLEIVYARKYPNQPSLVISRMVYRSILCYLSFISLAFIACLSGKIGTGKFLMAFGFLGSAPNTSIFRLYTFMLLLGIGFVALRVRYGMGSLLAVVGMVWVVDVLLLDTAGPWPWPFVTLGSQLFGLGSVSGPSVMHSITLVVFGMLLGNVAFGRVTSRWVQVMLALSLVTAAMILGWEIWSNGLRHLLTGIANIDIFRANNHPVYYAYGVLSGIGFMGCAYVLYKIAPLQLRSAMNRLGSETLTYFFIGNAIILLLPEFEVKGVWAVTALFAICLPSFCAIALLWLSWIRERTFLSRIETWAQARVEVTMMPRAQRRAA